MKKFKSLRRAIRRGHVEVRFNDFTGQVYLVRTTNKQSKVSKSNFVYNF